jgi:hypothetical protein
MSVNPEFNKNAGCPYASLSSYYHLKKEASKKKDKPTFAVPEFGSVGYNANCAKAAAASSCHVWRSSNQYDGRVLSSDAYPQCGPNTDCGAYYSKY